jgi:hypothetical protein
MECPENPQDYKWKIIVFRLYRPRCVLRSGASRELTTKELTTSMAGCGRRLMDTEASINEEQQERRQSELQI